MLTMLCQEASSNKEVCSDGTPVTLQLWHKHHTVVSKAPPSSLDRTQARNERTVPLGNLHPVSLKDT